MKLILIFCISTVTFATDKGNETGNRELPSTRLHEAILKEETYKIDKNHESCPPIVQLKKDRGQYHEGSQEGDIHFSMMGYKKDSDGLSWSQFTHENNSYTYRPGVAEGKSKKISGSCEFILGIACSSSTMAVKKDSMLFERSAKVLSFAMIAMIDSSFKFDSVNNKLTYIMKGNGIDDIICTYSKAPEYAADIKAYRAKVNAWTSPSVDDSSRSSRKPSTVESNIKVQKNANGMER